MPIFSANRVSGIGSTVVAAEGYTENDFGRILSECAINDMRLFNAAIARDFKEAQAMQEGTMMQSEIQALQEFSVKEAWKGLKEKIKKLWAKIKGVFKSVYAKLSLWLVKYNKAYIAMHRKDLLAKNCSGCKIPRFRDHNTPGGNIYDKLGGFSDLPLNAKSKLSDTVTYSEEHLKDFSKLLKGDIESMTKKGLKSPNYFKDCTVPSVDALYEANLKQHFKDANEDLTFGKCVAYGGSVQKLMDNLSGSSAALKALKKANKEADTAFKKAIRDLEGKSNKAEEEADQEKYKAASKVVGFFQQCVNASISAAIRLIKFSISNDRGLIATLVAYNPKSATNESALLEAAYMTGFQSLYMETDDLSDEDVAAEAEEEGVTITIDIDGDDDVDVDVNDNTDE